MQMYYSATENAFYHPAMNKLPDDAIALDGNTYRTLRDGLADGKTLSIENGVPVLKAQAVADRRQAALDAIDAAADKARAADRSIGQYLDAEYRLVQAALEQWRARDSDDAPVPLAIQDWADAQGITPNKAAEQIAEAAARAEELLQAVRRTRLAGKAAIRYASDDDDFMEVARPCIDQFEALATLTGA
ncbi:hypothetical protein [Larsenimonas suaedae]|uniref:Uncharacterized protein n=1 Tax=Larsenimonas suaedae TaxID=1851019 RepID=A0ABU1GYL3_9GAMM|nr:hypothetical protein [Larsenimonas suaedae]MCM2973496.1 hypothetical protein [Larsenimonas suaedae]MDR5897134.1 hypothetical protein [Larsenimonas suaedae]